MRTKVRTPPRRTERPVPTAEGGQCKQPMKSRVAIVKCEDYNRQRVEEAVRKALDLLGGVSAFIKPNQRVLLKPNLLSASPPESGVVTHPEVIRAVIRLVREAGGMVLVGDSPSALGTRPVEEVYKASGVQMLCQEEDVELVKFEQAILIDGTPIARIAKEADVIISIPKMKTHQTTILTGALKNMFGTVVGVYKSQCHFQFPRVEEFSNRLVDIFGHVRPSLSIMDGIIGMHGEGPAGGTLGDFGLILASQDAIALDAIFAGLAGLEPFEVFTTREAHRRGLGVGNLEDIEVLGKRVDEVGLSNFKLPGTSFLQKIPRPISRFAGRKIRSYPVIDQKVCVRCGLCAKICPAATIIQRQESYWVEHPKCTSCFCCYEVCPEGAIVIRRTLLARFFYALVKLRSFFVKK